MYDVTLVLAQAAQQTNPLLTFLPIILIFGVMYFVMIRPQRRRQQEAAAMLQSLLPGDDVVTIGGLHGVVKHVYDDAIDLEVTDDLTLRFERAAIARRIVHDDDLDTGPAPKSRR